MWIQRINAAARLEGMSYSKLMGALHKAGIEINRKVDVYKRQAYVGQTVTNIDEVKTWIDANIPATKALSNEERCV